MAMEPWHPTRRANLRRAAGQSKRAAGAARDRGREAAECCVCFGCWWLCQGQDHKKTIKTFSCSFVPQDDLDFCSSNARDREKRERRRSDIGARRAEHGGSRGGEGRGVRHAARSGGARGSDDARFAGERGAASARGEEGCVVASRRRNTERRGHRGKEERGRSLSHWRGGRTAPRRKGDRGSSGRRARTPRRGQETERVDEAQDALARRADEAPEAKDAEDSSVAGGAVSAECADASARVSPENAQSALRTRGKTRRCRTK